MLKNGYVYTMSNKNKTTFYIGVTSNLSKRVSEHKNGTGSLFTKKYNLVELVYFELIPDIEKAIEREKQLKRWHRDWKINLIKTINPEMQDLTEVGVE